MKIILSLLKTMKDPKTIVISTVAVTAYIIGTKINLTKLLQALDDTCIY
jgi:hypothetical protein